MEEREDADRKDGALVREARAGRREALEDLVRRWAPRVVAFCHSRVRSGGVAEDLAQEALLRAVRALGTLQDPERFGSWVFGIALRVCLDWAKRRERTEVPFGAFAGDTRKAEDLWLAPGGGEEDRLEREEELSRLLFEVEQLPPKLREALMLYYYQDVTYRDLGRMLGIAPATVNVRLTRARALLRERMAGRSESWRS